MVKNNVSIIIVLAFAILGGFSLLHPGLHPTHDGEYHVIRFYEFDKVMRDGDWYPRWAPDLNNGYGVPLFNYVYPLPNYVAVFLHLFGISFIDAFKLNMFIATLVGSIFFYLWSRIYWGNIGGVVSSVFYTFSPYHFVDIYIRGSVGEVWALAFFPAFLWAITKFLKGQKRVFLPISSIFLSLIIFSHNILSLMFFMFILSYIAFLVYRSKDAKFLLSHSLFILLLGLSLSSVFWIPALLETKYARGLQIYNFKDQFPEVYELIFPSWGSGFLPDDFANHMSYQIGVANVSVITFCVFVLLFQRKRFQKNRGVVTFFLVWFSILFFLMLKISMPIWNLIPLMNYFQFPWRFLSLEILFASFLAGAVVFMLNSRIIAFIFMLGVVLFGIGYAKPAYYHARNDEHYITRSNFIDGTNSSGNTFNTLWMNASLKKQKQKVVLAEQRGEISMISQKPTRYAFQVNIVKPQSIIINTAYFPGWNVFVDGVNHEVHRTDDGLMTFSVLEGRHAIEVKFQNTPIRNVSVFLSFFSFVSILFLFIKWKNV